jgi:spermidine synthase
MSRRKSPPGDWVEATISESRGIRYLHLGTPWIQGAMRVSNPLKLELEYIQRMMVWLLWRELDAWRAGHAVQLGLGAAAITRYCHKQLGMRTTAVELNPTVIATCRAWFALPPDGRRLQVIEGDAQAYAADPAHAGTVDALCVDLYDHEAASPVLDDEAFYEACHQLLTDDGVMTVNLFGREASFERSTARIKAAFGEERVLRLKATKDGNTIVVAWRGERLPPRQTLMQRAERIAAELKLPAPRWVKLLGPIDAEDSRPPRPGERVGEE